ncbi:VPLPA-CTERM sorting domain-containing protein [Rubrimonas cliftonensis]|uniref:VPLPA-CTERM protein sorting domain-containing protein n=1 Tax=Rubrimonas cliftonensis TaxID=89524 RepID=A0A1H4BUV3_9RHOB|nr:VPLPA-CTERM sorting domain-containing protein [Rubrimonas cliftonensis]SEA51847.1 VPLPA-CTERM protein sorting domain-containing protein [Rubrimonas cliftonensis]
MRFVFSPLLGAVALATLTTTPAAANTIKFFADLAPLSGSGVSGRADLALDTLTNALTVKISASGLAPNQLHVQHIHGLVNADGTPGDSRTPTLADDAAPNGDGDGIIELLEGVPAYGPILFSLTDETGAFPMAPDGSIGFMQTYDLAASGNFGDGFNMGDLMPLTFREIVIHGGFLGAVGIDSGRPVEEANGVAGYKTFLPVAAGEIQAVAPVPLPAAAWMLIAGVAALAGLRRSSVSTAA